ncbi:hypothetical protein Tco_0257703 [Tanacetum coccineum]
MLHPRHKGAENWPAVLSFRLETLIKKNPRTRKSTETFLMRKLLDRLLFVLIVPHGLQISQTTMRGIRCQGNVIPTEKQVFFVKESNTTSGRPLLVQSCGDQMIRRCVHGKEALRHSRSLP